MVGIESGAEFEFEPTLLDTQSIAPNSSLARIGQLETRVSIRRNDPWLLELHGERLIEIG